MGSFNMQCGVSHQIIARHDPCRVQPMLQQRAYETRVLRKGELKAEMPGSFKDLSGFDCFFEPLSGFIPAKYDECSKVTIEFDERTRQNLLRLFHQIYQDAWITASDRWEQKEVNVPVFMQSHAPAVVDLVASREVPRWKEGAIDDQFRACWAHIWDLAYEGRLYLSDHADQPRQLGFALLHEQTYQHLVSLRADTKGWDDESQAPLDVLKRGMAAARAKLAERNQTLSVWHLADRLESVLAIADRRPRPDSSLSLILEEMYEAVFAGIMTEDDVLAKCVPYLEDKYALASLDMLGLKLSLAQSAGQDYDNSGGRQYAAFISHLSKKVTHARNEVRFGPYRPYRLKMTSREQLKALAEERLANFDAAVEDVEVVFVDVDGTLHVRCACTMEPEDFRYALEEFELNGPEMAATIVAGV